MVQLAMTINLSEAAVKGLQRALAPGQTQEDLISLWVERHSLGWVGKLKAELQVQVDDLVAKYVDLPEDQAAVIKAQIDAVTAQLNKKG